MRASRLVKLFLNLDKRELTRFRNYLESEGTGYSMEAQLLLFDYLKANAAKKVRKGAGYTDLLDEAIVQQNLSKKNKSIKPANMNRIKHGLYKNLTDAIVHYQLEKERSEEDSVQRQMLLIRYLKNKLANNETPNKDLSDLYTNIIQETHKNTKSKTKKTILDYLDWHVLNHYLYFNVDTDAWAAGRELEELHNSIDLYYCLTKLKYCTEVMVRQRALNENNTVRLKQEVRRIADEFMESPTPLIQIYARCFDLFNKPEFDEKGLTTLVLLIKENLSLDISELAIVITFATNYIALSTKRGGKFGKIYFELHKIGFDKDLFVDEGFLEPNKLINYVFMCTEQDAGGEIPQILDTHLHKVKNKGKQQNRDGQRDKTDIICRAYHLFAIQKFAEAFDLLYEKSFRNEPYFMHFRTLRIKSIYEAEILPLGEFNFWEQTDTVKECKKFIEALRKREDVYNHVAFQQNINFAEMVVKMYHYMQDVNTTQAQKDALFIEVQSIQNIVCRDWLRLKTKEL